MEASLSIGPCEVVMGAWRWAVHSPLTLAAGEAVEPCDAFPVLAS